ncbi:hypothetical protein ATANTOWER_031597 [Ataeniobius toweri]|uniref:Uncharacterized protein n=1 Tax=Ataeniobius toweri TaxID=208326 RepID=A0ABU7CDV0_9TELE|nr:hypothetical protein [Ataeniobius toweri]
MVYSHIFLYCQQRRRGPIPYCLNMPIRNRKLVQGTTDCPPEWSCCPSQDTGLGWKPYCPYHKPPLFITVDVNMLLRKITLEPNPADHLIMRTLGYFHSELEKHQNVQNVQCCCTNDSLLQKSKGLL